MKRVVISMDGPGSHGELAMTVSEQEAEFLERMKAAWNEANPHHAAPMMELEVYLTVEKRDEARS